MCKLFGYYSLRDDNHINKKNKHTCIQEVYTLYLSIHYLKLRLQNLKSDSYKSINKNITLNLLIFQFITLYPEEIIEKKTS